ncbi:MAG: NADH-quinone oxidoreductase subunit L [Chloroflexi bacterium]|nr:NADH-quinone oxidoreductase subunit L [Chloroflexota bacterium]MBI5829670.1 NADH-quinone oxidoreductase subunit L [Chloroflexota bacterium]
MFTLIPLIIAFPLLGLLINVVAGKRIGDPWAGIIASLAAGAAFVIAVLQLVGLATTGFEPQVVKLADWIVIGQLSVPWAFQIDTLSVTMMLLVTGVGALIHVYAIGYMKGDERFHRFFVYLNLFIASMLVLVSGDNYLMLFVGWEGVGLCSYLLIGFWFDRGEGGVGNARAGRKAFVVNRVGDFGFVLAMFLIFWAAKSLTFTDVFKFFEEHGAAVAPLATAITLFMMLGAAGKSAQIPLFIWLPDAMAGPTPVSALIHAATMVTAGIYMIVRSNVIFSFAPASQMTVALIGAATAFVAGSIALGQFDIKRVLAYSTISQLGFMIAAAGMGAYVAAMFHLLTHAFFKALLFLSSGSVIHGMEHGRHALAAEGHGGGGHGSHTPIPPHAPAHDAPTFDAQDMRNMGNLRKHMPTTFWVYVIGSLALAGVVPFAGFWSKDEILTSAWTMGTWNGWVVFGLLLVAAFFTAFYMGRQVFMVFFGSERTEPAKHAHESPKVMLYPLIALAVLSVVGGALNLPTFIPGGEALGRWIEHTVEVHPIEFDGGVALISTVVALFAIGLSYLVYGRRPMTTMADPLEKSLGGLFTFLHGKWYVDELYQAVILRPFEDLSRFAAYALDWDLWHNVVHDTVIGGGFRRLAGFTAGFVDKGIVDRFFDGLGGFVRQAASYLRRLQTGYVRNYALAVLVGVLAILSLFFFLK